MTYRTIAALCLTAALLSACAGTPGGGNPPITLSTADSVTIENAVDQFENTGIAQLQLTIKVANAMTPADADGAQCAQAGITVINEVAQVTNVLQGQQLGGIPAAEVASVLIPGTAQFNNVVNVLGGGCFAKAHDVQAAITIASSPAAILAAAMPALQGLAPAVAPLVAGL